MTEGDDEREYTAQDGRSIKDIPMEEINELIVESIQDAIFLRLTWLKLQGVAKSLRNCTRI